MPTLHHPTPDYSSNPLYRISPEICDGIGALPERVEELSDAKYDQQKLLNIGIVFHISVGRKKNLMTCSFKRHALVYVLIPWLGWSTFLMSFGHVVIFACFESH